MGESTQYGVLGIVAAVAIVAIFAMSTSSSPQAAVPQTIENEIVNAVGNDLPAYNQLDYDDDGYVDFSDVDRLNEQITRNTCAKGKVCDVSGDGVLSQRDVDMLSGLFVVEQQQQEPQRQAITGNTVVTPRYIPEGPKAGSSSSIPVILA